MIAVVLTFVASAAAIIVAGSFLARSADQIAEITRLGRLVVGSVLLAGATSLPELSVDLNAVRQGWPNLAVGDLLGSSLMNLMILAILDLTHHARGKMLSRSAAAHALSGTMALTLTALVGAAIAAAPRLPDWTLLHLSPATWLILFAYLLGVRIVFLDQRISVRVAAEVQAEQVPPPSLPPPPPPLWKPAAVFVAAAAVIFVAAPHLAASAARLAEMTGLGKTFVGTTLVAFSTSLPELVSSFAAVRMGAFDLAVGNVFGSNTFNMVLFVPLDAVHSGSLFAALSAAHGITCLAVILATGVTVMGQLYHVETRWRLIEPDALLVLAVVVGGLALIYYCG